MSLLKHPILEGKMPKAWLETAFRFDGDCIADEPAVYEETRFQLCCDEVNGPLGAVSEKYCLVQIRDMVAALDLICERLGLAVEPVKAMYKNGRSQLEFVVPSLAFRAPGDPSKTQARFVLGNDYRGAGNLKGLAGWFRFICSNGMTEGEILTALRQRHVGSIDVYGFVEKLVVSLSDRFEVNRVLAETLARTPHTFTGVDDAREVNLEHADGQFPSLVDSIIADTAKRYDNELRRAMRENNRELGDNLWAVTQAVSEVATHRMPGFTADEWATRQLNRIRAMVD